MINLIPSIIEYFYELFTGEPYTGFRDIHDPLYLKYPQVTEIYPESPAEQAGLAVGEWIIKIDGQSLADGDKLAAAISSFRSDQRLTFRMGRSSEKPYDAEVRLIPSTKDPDHPYLGLKYRFVEE